MSGDYLPGDVVVQLDEARDVVLVELTEILPADDNPRDHDIPKIIGAILRFGYTQPVMRDERTGKLVAGHGRCRALAELRDDPAVQDRVAAWRTATPAQRRRKPLPKGLRVDDDRWAPRGIALHRETGAWLVPVMIGWASDSDVEAEAYLVGDNRMTELARWQDRGLADMLLRIQAADADLMVDAGYEQHDLDLILRRLEPDDDDDLGDDDPNPEDMWPTITINRCPPVLAAAWRSHVDTCSGRDVEALAELLQVNL